MSDTPNNPLQQLWQQQPVDGTRMSLDEIRRRAAKFERRIFWRNTREYVGGGIAMILFGYFFAHAHDTLTRIAFGLFIAGMAYVLIYLYVRGGTAEVSPQSGARCAEFFLQELERQRRLVSNLWWYLGPLVPGAVLLAVASAVAHPQPKALLIQMVANLVMAAGFLFALKMNTRAARCLQKQIDELIAGRKRP